MLRKVINGLNKCKKVDRSRTTSLIQYARNQATEFYYDEYIDLDSWYKALLSKTRSYISSKVSEKKSRESKLKYIVYKNSLIRLESRIQNAQSALDRAIVANASGYSFSGNKANGVSIYYPKYSLHSLRKELL